MHVQQKRTITQKLADDWVRAELKTELIHALSVILKNWYAGFRLKSKGIY